MVPYKVNSSFGEYLRHLREKNNFTLRGLATEINIDSSLIAKIERGERQPTRDQIKIISEFFKISENNLFVDKICPFLLKIILISLSYHQEA